MYIDIIGGGIGGLTTAIALEQKGIKTRVFEQAKEIKPTGAGIILASNAMQIFEKLGLRKIIEQNGHSISSMNIINQNLNPISKVDLSYFEKKHEVKNIAIHRGILQKILINKLEKTTLKLDYRLKNIELKHKKHLLVFENGIKIESSVLIAADGLKSMVRQKLFPNNTIRNAKQICWRGITNFNLPIMYKNELNEVWHQTNRFGFVPIAENKVYWYALKSFNKYKEELTTNKIQSYFKNCHSIFNEIIHSTNEKEIYTAEILDLKPTKNWYRENVCLLGDAAHAATPNMGQGACQAIEDAYVISELINKYNINYAFQEFQKIRLPKAHAVVNTSWMIGKISHLENPILSKLRNHLMRSTPSFLNRKQTANFFQIPTL